MPKFNCQACNGVFNTRGDNLPAKCNLCNSPIWDYGHNKPCQVCSRNLLRPVVHHVNGNHDDNRSENRLFLCEGCHTGIHKGLGSKRAHPYNVLPVIEKMRLLNQMWKSGDSFNAENKTQFLKVPLEQFQNELMVSVQNIHNEITEDPALPEAFNLLVEPMPDPNLHIADISHLLVPYEEFKQKYPAACLF